MTTGTGHVDDRAHDALVGEREEVLEAPAAAGEDDDVDVGLGRDRAERLAHGRGGALSLDERLGDDDPRRWEARLDRGQHVALGGGVVPGDEADPAGQARQRPLARLGEEPLGGELRLQALQRREVLADPEALDRECPQPQLALLLPELGPPVHVHALAVREVEAQPVELPARHRRREAGAALGVLQREEDGLPAGLAAQVGQLALDPERRQALEPRRDALVEPGDRVDLAVAVDERLDLHANTSRRRFVTTS